MVERNARAASARNSNGAGGGLVLATSRYQNSEAIGACGLVPVAITRGRPRWKLPYRFKVVSVLAPSREVFSVEDPVEFDAAYRAQLDAVGVTTVHERLATVSRSAGGSGLVLLCFEDVEALGEFSCHRRSFSRWWEEKTGSAVPELPARPSNG